MSNRAAKERVPASDCAASEPAASEPVASAGTARELAAPGSDGGLLGEIAALSLPAGGVPGPTAGFAPIIARLVGFDERGRPLVELGALEPVVARTLLPLGLTELGREALVTLVAGAGPVIMGLLEPEDAPQGDEPATSARPTSEADVGEGSAPAAERAPEITRDGERIVLEAEREIVLRCGKASITLTRAGKILLRGAYLSSRSTGVNRILGGSVEIN